jgi:hypothetical protein
MEQCNVPERLVETLLELNLPGSGARLSTPALPAEVGVRPLDIGVSSPTCRERQIQTGKTQSD